MLSKKLKAGLYIVATPIGNLDDITIRALDTLKKVDLILCEDTRHSRTLLTHYGINKPLWSYNDHSTEKNRFDIIQKIEEDNSIALISDAGTPLISDPGYKLVSLIHQNNLFITTCPGPCSLIAALCLSGCPTDRFSFVGFLPNTSKDRSLLLNQMRNTSGSLILFSTANKLNKDLEAIHQVFGNIEVSITRELTKIFEERITQTIETLLHQLKITTLKGEIILIIPPQTKIMLDDSVLSETISILKNHHLSSKDIVKVITSIDSNIAKSRIYQASIK